MQKSVKQIRLQTMVRLLCGSTRDFTEGFYMSRKELYSSCSILDISDNEKCVHRAFFDLLFWGKCNESSSCRAPVNILWSMEAVRWMSVPWPCAERSP